MQNLAPQNNVMAGYAAGLIVAGLNHGLTVSYGMQIPPDVSVGLTALVTALVPHLYDVLVPAEPLAAPPANLAPPPGASQK